MTPPKKPDTSAKESTGSSTAQIASLSDDQELVILVMMAGLMFLTGDGWEKFMQWMRQDEFFSGLEEATLKSIFLSAVITMEEKARGTRGETSKKSAAS